MRSIVCLLVVALVGVDLSAGATENHLATRKGREIVIENVADLSMFYDLKDNHTIKDMLPRPWIIPGQSLKLPFSAGPCTCENLGCGCCAGIKITQINFDRQACANLAYDEYLFGLVLDVTVNNKSVIHNVFSAKNPPPLCIPVPLGGIPGIDLCIRLFDIYTIGTRNIHVCMDWELRVIMTPVLILHFDCLKFGADGVSIVKPGVEDELLSGVTETAEESTDGDVFDPVTEIKNLTATELPDAVETTTLYEDTNTIASKVE